MRVRVYNNVSPPEISLGPAVLPPLVIRRQDLVVKQRPHVESSKREELSEAVPSQVADKLGEKMILQFCRFNLAACLIQLG